MSAASFIPAEFDCCECARHIVVLSSETPPNPRLCAACLCLPGWFTHPGIRAAIDPDHDGREPALDQWKAPS